MAKYDVVCVGIDQSYKRTGVSISADGELLLVKSITLEKFKNNSEKRKKLREYLANMVYQIRPKAKEIVCVIERIRLQSDGFLNINYIKSIGALNSVIVDVFDTWDIPVYSVDTRCWKSQVVGTSKPEPNEYNVDPKKYPTIKFVEGLEFGDDILIKLGKKREVRRTKGVFIRGNYKYCYNDDAADSAAISLFYFVGNRERLKIER